MKDQFTPEQMALIDMWERHTLSEFELHSPDAALATMSKNPHIMHVPTLTGGHGRKGVHDFYSKYFIPHLPADIQTEIITRTVGQNRVIDEFIFKFTHTIDMPWMLPGIKPTGKHVEVPFIAVVQFEEGKVESEHIYWDQAAVLVQLGLLDQQKLPITGTESVHRLRDPTLPANDLIFRLKKIE